ncbi:hypothetical protein [Phyllobacterium endophyticum]|uniref:hypothetical protein n=1 Tax=Phyllobacterium endophyticum TaxID=1149773 RepID=UPI0014759136|nr:hypothetical protein [Phyllobacterium endophyticum]MBB3233379.1 hypothetical protein [Phyllobacterium endophyticum]
MRQRYLVLPALVAIFSLLAALAFCSGQDPPPGSVEPNAEVGLDKDKGPEGQN